jgi:hypothetical protein
MNTDLFMLTLSALLSFMQVMPITIGYFIYWGPKVIVSNREDTPPLPGWVTRGASQFIGKSASIRHIGHRRPAVRTGE